MTSNWGWFEVTTLSARPCHSASTCWPATPPVPGSASRRWTGRTGALTPSTSMTWPRWNTWRTVLKRLSDSIPVYRPYHVGWLELKTWTLMDRTSRQGPTWSCSTTTYRGTPPTSPTQTPSSRRDSTPNRSTIPLFLSRLDREIVSGRSEWEVCTIYLSPNFTFI